MALRPWYKVVTPREDLRDGKPSMHLSSQFTLIRLGTDVPRRSIRTRSAFWSAPF